MTTRPLTAPYAMINLVRLGSSATSVLLDTAAFLETKGAEFIEWTALRDGATEVDVSHFATTVAAREWLQKLQGLRSVSLVFRSVANPQLGSTEELDSNESPEPSRAGSTLTYSISGEEFCDSKPNQSNSREFGRIFSFFLELIDAVDVSYGGVTVEYVMESAYELPARPYGYAFYDFFISHDLLSSSILDGIREKFPSGTASLVPRGVAVFASWYNPASTATSKESYNAGSWVAQELAKVITSRDPSLRST